LSGVCETILSPTPDIVKLDVQFNFFHMFNVLQVIALIGGAILVNMYLPAYVSVEDMDLPAVLGGFAAFIVSLLAVKIIIGKINNKTANTSVFESIIEV
jgi:hypothetical protein